MLFNQLARRALRANPAIDQNGQAMGQRDDKFRFRSGLETIAKLLSKLDNSVDDLGLLLVDPAGERCEEELEGAEFGHQG